MNQIEIVSNYIKGKFSHFQQDKENEKIFYFKNEKGLSKKVCIVEEKEVENKSILFNKNFELILTPSEEREHADYYVFSFGNICYYIKGEEAKKPKLHILRYLGQYEVDNSNFVHLGIHSTYTLLNGCQKIENYIEKAKYLNMKALGICEKGLLNSCIKFQNLCKENNIKSIIGEELKIKIEDKFYWFKFYIKNKQGYVNLITISNIITIFKKKEEKDYLNEEELLDLLDGLVVIFPNNFPFSIERIAKYKKYDCYYQIDTVQFIDYDYYTKYLDNIKEYLKQRWNKNIPPVLIGDSYYLDKEDKEIQDIVRKIGNYSESEYASNDRYFKSVDEHIEIFSQYWQNKEDIFDEFFTLCIQNTKEIADKCNFELKFEKLHIPLARINQDDYNEAIIKKEKLNKLLKK